MRFARLVLVLCALLALPVPAVSAAEPVAVDHVLSARLRQAVDARRGVWGRDPVFVRPAYHADAEALARRALDTTFVPSGRDGAPAAVRAVSAAQPESTAVHAAIDEVAAALDAATSSPYYTDAGWSVVVRRTTAGYRVGVAAVLGWPAPTLPVDARCTGWGYCWSARGPNPHLRAARNRLTWHLSTAGLPAGGEDVVRAALYRVDSVAGFGAQLAYGGRVPDTRPSAARPFLVVFADACRGVGAIGCAEVDVHGPYSYVVGARVVVMASRYRATPNRDLWIGTVAHEIAHALGLGHYDAVYAGRHQLMRSAAGPNTPQAGDVNGLRAVAPPGRLGGRMRLRAASISRGGAAEAVVTGWNDGLGGVREVRVDCRDASGAWRVVARAAGAFDTPARDHPLFWLPDRTTTCRPAVRAKAANWYGPEQVVSVR